MKNLLTRREALRTLATAAAGVALLPPLSSAQTARRTSLGIGMHSYGVGWKAGRERKPEAHFHDALTFLQHAHDLGAGGVQVSFGACDKAYAANLRESAEKWGMHLEAQTSLPKQERDLERFEAEALSARAAGAKVLRTALLGGRRYETFSTLAAFNEFREASWKSLTLSEPIARKHQLRLAVENHKDWLAEDLAGIMKRLSSEWVGVCVDIGNNLALLEDPYTVVETLAPYAASTHIKDMAVQEYLDGFLLSEVPLGGGFLDLRRIIALLKKANPNIRWNLEMITRDPLEIPCLTQKYWATMPDRKADALARMLALVRKHSSERPLPKTAGLSEKEKLDFEEGNVRRCLEKAPEFGL